ncbi:hypothetical protein [Pararhodobacter zhoushanensis]|uniref:hypothetical protein n=1 Tax=Pararhodobacter zhoushanensis TaxID=2479545 RepID=UPI000F8CD9A7|nr:hypothetical protein [Pararhodobacter zhoushanensis]
MRLLSLTLALSLAALPLHAQDGPGGIAFVQAPELSWGMGMGATPEEAFAAATAQCVDGGALAEDCLQTNWCYPAGWSIDVFLQHQEGLHWHEVICGLPSAEAGQAVAEALCDRSTRSYLLECQLVQIYDADGAAQMAE